MENNSILTQIKSESNNQDEDRNIKNHSRPPISPQYHTGYREIFGSQFHQGFYCPTMIFHNVLAFQSHFKTFDNDVIITSKPKSGTTWLKSWVFYILYRNEFNKSNQPLLTKNSHEVAPNLEFDLYINGQTQKVEKYAYNTDDGKQLAPRLLSTHLPYHALTNSIKTSSGSNCKLVYVSRNPYDTLVSGWKFMAKIVHQEIPLEDYVEDFCKGVEAFGPHWDHVLGYWRQSLENPDKVLFLKYEDMQKDGILELKRLAKFLGCEFTQEEEKQGVVEEILKFCSINSIKNLDVNKIGERDPLVKKNSWYFRKGVIGDWVNHLSPEMYKKLSGIIKEKFASSGLEFDEM